MDGYNQTMQETIPIWAQWLFGAGVPTIFIAGAGAFWRLLKRLDRMDLRFERIERTTDQIRLQTNGQLTLIGSLVGSLNEDRIITPERTSAILGHFVQLTYIGPTPNNPISAEEHQRLLDYIELARNGGPFTEAQVTDYQEIVAKLEAEKPRDNEVWGLLALGALLLGLYILAKKD